MSKTLLGCCYTNSYFALIITCSFVKTFKLIKIVMRPCAKAKCDLEFQHMHSEISFISTLIYNHELLLYMLGAGRRRDKFFALTIHIIFWKQLFLVLPSIYSCCFIFSCPQNFNNLMSPHRNLHPCLRPFALQISQHHSFRLTLLISAECVLSRHR